MNILSGYNYRKLTKKLGKMGFTLKRQGKGSHAIWFHPEKTDYTLSIPCHPGDISEYTLRGILKKANISIDEFLKA